MGACSMKSIRDNSMCSCEAKMLVGTKLLSCSVYKQLNSGTGIMCCSKIGALYLGLCCLQYECKGRPGKTDHMQ